MPRILWRYPFSSVMLTLVVWWSVTCLFAFTFNILKARYSDDQDLEYALGIYEGGVYAHRRRENLRRRGKISRREAYYRHQAGFIPESAIQAHQNIPVFNEKKMVTLSTMEDYGNSLSDHIALPRRSSRSLSSYIDANENDGINDIKNDDHKYKPERSKTLVTIVCETDQSADLHQKNSFSAQLNQTKMMLKTLILFSKSSFKVVLVTDSRTTYDLLLQQVYDWPESYRSRLEFEIAGLWSPPKGWNSAEVWNPCSWSRLFLLESLPHINSAVYVDTDTIFLGPADHLWEVLEDLESPTVMALAPEPVDDKEQHQRFPGSVGLSTSLMVLDLTALRIFRSEYGNFTSTLYNYKNQFPSDYDQDILNALLTDHPEMFLELGAQWNFAPSQCVFGVLTCCVDTGVNVLHGFDATFVRGVEMIFQVVYEGFLRFDMTSYMSDLVKNVEYEFYRVNRLALSSPCKKVWGIQDVIIKHMRELASKEEKSLGQFPEQR